MGEVCLADDLQLDRRVAVKFLTEAPEHDVRGQLLTEARAAAALDHPFICKIFEVTEVEGRPCIVMEYVRGETIERRLRRGPLPVTDVLRLADEMAEALEAAHKRRVIHRDLKPANVIVTDDGHVKVMDFGLATYLPMGLNDVTLKAVDADSLAGTPAYMAPELIRGDSPDRRSDIFSFGILLYEMLAGTHPFVRGRLETTFASILADTPADLHQRSPAVPRALSAIVARLLMKDPDVRYQGFGEVRVDLRRVAADAAASSGEVRRSIVETRSADERRMFGRDAERTELMQHVSKAIGGHGALVLLQGEAGVGKSRLAEDVLSAARRLGCQTLVGRCHEEEGTPPLAPYLEVLDEAARLMPPAAFREAIGRSAPELVRVFPELQRLFPDMPPPLELPPELRQRFLFTNVREFLTRTGHLAPLVVFLDDCQWADESTMQLTQHLASHLHDVPVLVIGAWRDADGSPARPKTGALQQLLQRFGLRSKESGGQAGASVSRIFDQLLAQRQARAVRLQPLTQEAVGGMLGTLGKSDPPARLVRQFFDETEGNPYFVEELFQHMKDEGRLFDDRGKWRRDSSFSDVKVPPSVRTLIDRRIQRVSSAARDVLATAAVIGRHFDLDLLEAVAGASVRLKPDATSHGGATSYVASGYVASGFSRTVPAHVDVIAALEEAERADIVKGPSGRQESRWRFGHQLICQTLAGSVPATTRQRLHLRIADAIGQLSGPDGPSRTQASDVAHHLYNAGPLADAGRTARALVAAGDAAHTVYATDEAVRHYRRALEVLTDAKEEAASRPLVQERLGDLLALTGDRRGAMDQYQLVARVHQASGNCSGEARLVRKIGGLHWQAGDRGQAMASYQRALAMLEGSGAHLESAHLFQELGLAAFRSGDNQRAVEWAERALAAAEAALGDSQSGAPGLRRAATAAMAHATNTIGVALARAGQLDAARERIERSIAEAREHGLLDVACRGYANLGVLYSTVEPQRAIDVSLTGLELASRIGAASMQSYIYANLAAAYCALTEQCETEGLVAARAAVSLDRELGQLDHLAVPLIVLAQIHQCHGRLDDAQETYREALGLAEKIGEPQLILPCYDGLATIALDRGDKARAEQFMEKARDLCERTGLDPDTLLLLPFLC
jgi:adenylate cyclase